MKWLVRKNPQSLVSFLLGDAVFEGEVDRELPVPSVIADALYAVTWQGKQVVLHVEFQRNRHPEMGRRLWEYNALTNIHTKLPVYSVVIYLVEDKPLVQSPYVIPLPDGRPTQRLDFETIKLWEIPPEVFEQQGLAGLLPLLPLTKGGKNRETVERMIKGLEEADKQDLLVLGYAFSSLLFTADGDGEWLKERFSMMHDILKDTWVFQEIIKEGLEEGKKEGLQEGLQEGLKEGLGEGLLQIIEIRFPPLLAQAKQVVELQTSVEQLRVLSSKLYRANTIEETRAVLQAYEMGR
jgi:predicted transposase YdaD